MSYRRPIAATLLVLSVALVSACEEAEDKAQRKYDAAVTLVDEGDPDRAVVELKGAFDLDPTHYQARMLYADLQKEAGNINEAIGHYRLASEQHPRELQPRLEILRFSLNANAVETIEAQLAQAEEIAPDDKRVISYRLLLDMRRAVMDRDNTKLTEVAETAREFIEEDPSLDVARRVLIDTLYQLQDPYGALEVTEAGLEMNPDDAPLNEAKLRLLVAVDDQEGIGAQMRRIVELTPENEKAALMYVQWMLSVNDIDGADSFLRSRSDPNNESTDPQFVYVRFLLDVRGEEAAMAELDRLIAESTNNTDTYAMLKASLQFDLGHREEALVAMRSLLEGRESNDLTRTMQVALAQMLMTQGNRDEAYAMVDAVLAEDPRQTGALKLNADRLIEDDLVGDAIISLRTALDQDPLDADIYTLLAKAHQREGSRDLMGDNLGEAVRVSNSAAPESLRYARFLMGDEKFPSARDVVLQAVRRSPGNIELLRLLSEIYIGMAEWPSAEGVIQALRRIDTDEARLLADSLEATLLQRRERTDESLALLRGMLTEDRTSLVAQAAIIRTHLANNDVNAARQFLDGLLAEDPDNTGTQFLNAALLSVERRFDEAAAVYRALLDENPEAETIWRAYVANLTRGGNNEAALAALDEALVALPDSMNLLWIKASYEEQQGDIPAAIAIYEDLYQRDSGSTIVANNLASLLSSYSDDPEALDRAYVIARRLRGTRIPAFQDTYGWIAFRLGNIDESEEYLRAAAASLTQDPLVQEHFAEFLRVRGENDEARTYYQAALDLLPPDTSESRTRIEAAMAALAEDGETAPAEETTSPE